MIDSRIIEDAKRRATRVRQLHTPDPAPQSLFHRIHEMEVVLEGEPLLAATLRAFRPSAISAGSGR